MAQHPTASSPPYSTWCASITGKCHKDNSSLLASGWAEDFANLILVPQGRHRELLDILDNTTFVRYIIIKYITTKKTAARRASLCYTSV